MIGWPLPGLFVAWGLRESPNNQWSPDALARRAAEAGYTWLALELDDFGNAARWPAFLSACTEHGVLPGIWVTDGGNIDYTPFDAAFAIAEVESQPDYDGLMLAITEEALPDCPLAIVTNFSPFVNPLTGEDDPALAAPIIAAGFECLTEAYMGDNPNATPDNLDFRGRRLGWARTAPVFGLWNAPLAMYEQWTSWPGWSGYLAEHVIV